MQNDYFKNSNNFEEHIRQRIERLELLKIERAYDKEIEIIRNERINQQKELVFDSRGNRWCKCKYCGKIATLKFFSSYGGPGQINRGTCYDCNDIAGKETKDKLKNIGNSGKLAGNACPWCGGKVIRKNSMYGDYWGCINYPNCRFKDNISPKKY